MIEITDVNDGRAVRNKSNILVLYDLMIRFCCESRRWAWVRIA